MRSGPVQHHPPVAVIKSPFLRFAQFESSEGILLLACTLAALILSNSPWADAWTALWQTRLTVSVAGGILSKSLLHWVNEGLMAVFFFVVGLEIKREILVGELSSVRKAALPVAAAAGGMVVPACLYAAVNWNGPGAAGWGIPMATDIAFALGAMTLLGPAVPTSLKVFLTALAIVDDIGAVLVIAFFYTSEPHWIGLAIMGVFLAALILTSWAGARHPLVYLLLGLGLWVGFLESGIHATLAGVVLAMTVPARSRMHPDEFLKEARGILDAFDRADDKGPSVLSSEQQQSAVFAVENAAERVQTPLTRMAAALHPWVTYLIMPLFALANAGVALRGDVPGKLLEPVGLGVIVGLLVGKPAGILAFSAAAVWLGWASVPRRAGWRQIAGMGCLAGIGFTMSIFIANLALDAELLGLAKAAVLLGSLLSGLAGWLLLRGSLVPSGREPEDVPDPGASDS